MTISTNKTHCPIRNFQKRKYLGRDLSYQPANQPITVIIENAQRHVRFSQVWRENKSVISHLFHFCQLRFGERFDEPMPTHAAFHQPGIGQGKIRIECDCLLIPRSRLVKRFRFERSIGRALLELALQKKICTRRCFSSAQLRVCSPRQVKASPEVNRRFPARLRFQRQTHL